MVETVELTYAEPTIAPEMAGVRLYPEVHIASASPGFNVPTFATGAQLQQRIEWINDNQLDVQNLIDSYNAGKTFQIKQIKDQQKFENEQFATRTEPAKEKAIAPAPVQNGVSAEQAKSEEVLKAIFAMQGISYDDVAKGMGATADSLAGIEQAERNIATATAQATSQGLVGGTKEMEIKRELTALETKKQSIIEMEKQLGEMMGAALGGAGGVNLFHGAEPGQDEPGKIGAKAGKEPVIEKPEIEPNLASAGKVTTHVGPQLEAARFDTGHDDFQKAARVTEFAAIDSGEVARNPMDDMLKGAGLAKLSFSLDGEADIPMSSPGTRAQGFAKVQSTGMSLGKKA